MRFGDLTFEEIRECVRAGWIVVVPTGCTEQHGPHLPVDFDTWFSEAICLAAAARAAELYDVHMLVLSALPFGPTPEHRTLGYGFIDLPVELHHTILLAVLDSLADQGFKKMILWRGCGQHTLQPIAERFNQARSGQARAFYVPPPYYPIWMKIGNPQNPGGHADAFETSMALYMRPEAVRLDRIVNPHNEPLDWDTPYLDLSRYTRTGVIGDPTEASAELGARLWEAVVEEMARNFKQVAEMELA